MTLKLTHIAPKIIIPLWAMCIFFGLKITAQAAENISLCATPHHIATSQVTLADVFCQGLKADIASHVLAPTPAAGDKLVLNTAELNRVAQSFKLAWQAPMGAELMITSNQTTISADTIKEALTSNAAFEDLGDLDITLNNQAAWVLPIHVETPSLKVDNVKLDTNKQSFVASISALQDNKKTAEQTVQGTWQEMLDVPVLNVRVPNNTTITADMVQIQRLPKKDVSAGTVLAINDLTGMVAKRALTPNKPLATTALMAPILIKRNDLVTIRYTKGTMQLETQARAMANGAKGEWVSFMNMSSKKLLEARVIGPQLAEIVME